MTFCAIMQFLSSIKHWTGIIVQVTESIPIVRYDLLCDVMQFVPACPT